MWNLNDPTQWVMVVMLEFVAAFFLIMTAFELTVQKKPKVRSKK